MELQEAVKALTAGKTLVMIAHRMKTVQEADQILVLDQGRIVQRGPPCGTDEAGRYLCGFCLLQEIRRIVAYCGAEKQRG